MTDYDDEDFDADEFYDMADDDDAFDSGRQYGIREGERRMLWALACGAHLASELEGCGDGLACVTGMAYGMVANDALRALRDLGDEDASRVLGERGW